MRTGDCFAVVLAALAVSGCSRPHAGTLASATPSPMSPVVSTVRSYYAALERAAHAPGSFTDDLARLIDPACSCRQVIDVLREEARRGRHGDYTLGLPALALLRDR